MANNVCVEKKQESVANSFFVCTIIVNLIELN